MVCPLWKRACGGQRGFKTWVSLKSAMKGPRIWARAEVERRSLPGESILWLLEAGVDVDWILA